MHKNLRTGIAYGLITWGAFAAVEIANCAVRPLALKYFDIVETSYWYFTAMLLLLYLATGALFGLTSSYLAARRRGGAALQQGVFQLTATLGLLVVYLLNLAIEVRGWDSAEMAALVVSVTAFGILAVALFFPGRLTWAKTLAEPWVAATVLLGIPLVASTGKVVHALAVICTTVTAAFLSRRFLSVPDPKTGLPLRQFAAVAVALVVVLVATAALSTDLPPLRPVTAKKTRGPNIILVVMDTVRADHLSVYGYRRETTPNLKRFSEGATLYRRANAPANWTLPSHASLFTGLYPRAHGASNAPYESNPRPLGSKHPTIATLLRSAGYQTVAEVANIGFVRADYGLAQGFNTFDVREILPCARQRDGYYPRRLGLRIIDHLLDTPEFDRVNRTAGAITDDAIRLLTTAAAGPEPFFLFLNYMDAHDYLPPAPYKSMFPGRTRKMYGRYLDLISDVISQRRSIAREEREHFVSQYDGAIRYIDSQLGRLIQSLKDLNVHDNSIIVITSDHGEAFGERNFVNHRQSLYQNQISVPLLIKYPGQSDSRIEDRRVSLVDLTPTILATAGLPCPAGLHGQNLLSPPIGQDRPLFAEAYVHSELARLRPNHPPRQFAIFRDNLKLIASSNGRNELYDVSSDPDELTDRYATNREVAKDLRAKLDDWLNRVPTEIQPGKRADPRTLERLRALGYVQ